MSEANILAALFFGMLFVVALGVALSVIARDAGAEDPDAPDISTM